MENSSILVIEYQKFQYFILDGIREPYVFNQKLSYKGLGQIYIN